MLTGTGKIGTKSITQYYVDSHNLLAALLLRRLCEPMYNYSNINCYLTQVQTTCIISTYKSICCNFMHKYALKMNLAVYATMVKNNLAAGSMKKRVQKLQMVS